MPLLLVLLLAIPTALLPERPVAEPTVGLIDAGGPASIATDGTNFLVVSSGVVKFNPTGQYAMLLDGDAQPLWKTSVRASDIGWSASAAWNGSEYLVASGTFSGRVDLVRLDDEGHVLDANPVTIQLPSTLANPAFPTTLWDGSQFVVLAPSGSPPALSEMRVSSSGEVVQKNLTVIPQMSWNSSWTAAAANGITVVIWKDDTGGAHEVTVNSAGVVSPVSDLPRAGMVTAGADGFVVTSVKAGNVWLQHLSPAGQPDSAPVQLPITATTNVQVLSTGSSYLLIYGDQMVHISGSGQMLDAPRTIPPGVPTGATYAANGTSAIGAWYADNPTAPPSYSPGFTVARRLDGEGSGAKVQRAYFMQRTPCVVWRGEEAIASWTEGAVREQAISSGTARQVSQDGDVEIGVASGPTATLHLIARGAWYPYKPWALHAIVDGGDDVLVDASPIDLRFAPAVWTGRDFIVVWKRAGTTEIMGARLDATGHVTNGPTQIADAQLPADLAIGASDSEALVVWQDRGVANGVLLTASGEIPVDPVTTVKDSQFGATSFSIASDGRNFLVTWINKSDPNPDRQPTPDDWIGGRLFDANGRGLTPLTDFSPGKDRKWVEGTFWTGSEYLVVWSSSSGLSALRVTPEGRLIDYPPVAIGSIDGEVTSTSRGPSGQIAVAYARGGRGYTRFIVPARQRSAVHR